MILGNRYKAETGCKLRGKKGSGTNRRKRPDGCFARLVPDPCDFADPILHQSAGDFPAPSASPPLRIFSSYGAEVVVDSSNSLTSTFIFSTMSAPPPT